MRKLLILLLLPFMLFGQVPRQQTMGGFTPAVNLDFTKATLPSNLTFTRSSIATRVNASGVVETVAANVPRFDYDPTSVVVSGQNLCGYSEQFDNAYWNKAGVSVQANSINSPTGTATADKLTEDAIFGSHRVYIGAGSIGNLETMSVYAKAAERNWLILGAGAGLTSFNLSTGVLGSVASGFSATISSAGNGWYRCTISGVRSANNNTLIYVANGNNSTTYTGDGTSGLYVWGVQLETSGSVGPYIPTASTPIQGTSTATVLKGLLIEEGRMNLVKYSEQIDDNSWGKNSITVTANSIPAPTGLQTADLLSATSVTTNTGLINQQAPVATGNTYTFSVYAKKGSSTGILLQPNAAIDAVTTGASVRFNLSTLAMSSSQYGTGLAYISSSITHVGNSWYRCTVTFSLTGTSIASNVVSLWAYPYFPGDAVNSTAYIWGAQLELGTFATSYIPTTTAAVTRNLDLCSISTSFLNIYQGSFFVDYRLSALPLSRAHILSLNDGGSNRLSIRAYDAATGSSFVIGDGTNVKTMSYAVVANQSYRAAMAYNATNAGIAVNGALTNTSTTGYLFAAGTIPSTVFIGSTGATTAITGWISRIRYYPNRLPNSYLQSLTN